MVPAVPAWDKLFSYSFWESNKNSKSKIERPLSPLPQECGHFTNHKHSPRPSPEAQIFGWLPGERGCPPGFWLFRRGPRETRLQRALSKTETEKNPRLAHRGGRREAIGDFSAEWRGPETTQFPLLPSAALLRSPARHPGPRTPRPHMVCPSSSEHMNFKMVTRAGGGEGAATREEGSKSPGTSKRARESRKEPLGGGWGALGDAHVGGTEGGAPGKGGGRNGTRPL